MRDKRHKPKAATLAARQLLKQWIARAQVTQEEAACRIGISRVKLNQYLNAEARPSLETAIRIEDATGISTRQWLTDFQKVTSGNMETGDVAETHRHIHVYAGSGKPS